MDYYAKQEQKKYNDQTINFQNFVPNLGNFDMDFDIKNIFNLDEDQRFFLQLLGIGLTIAGGVITLGLVADSYFDRLR